MTSFHLTLARQLLTGPTRGDMTEEGIAARINALCVLHEARGGFASERRLRWMNGLPVPPVTEGVAAHFARRMTSDQPPGAA